MKLPPALSSVPRQDKKRARQAHPEPSILLQSPATRTSYHNESDRERERERGGERITSWLLTLDGQGTLIAGADVINEGLQLKDASAYCNRLAGCRYKCSLLACPS